jgi:hypothetical protein
MSVEIKIPKDLSKVDANDLGELIWWSNHLGISPELLLSIINERGSSAETIRKNIHSRHCNNKTSAKNSTHYA